MKSIFLLLASAAALTAPPVLAQPTVAAVAQPARVPVVLGPNARIAYRAVFDAIAARDWDNAADRLALMEAGPLHPYARALIYTAKGSPKVEAADLITLAAAAPELPQAVDLIRLAAARGAVELPELPETHAIGWLGETAPRRARAASTGGDAGLGALIQPLIKDDRPMEAEATLIVNENNLPSEALTEWRQRVAWSYFLTGDDDAARRVAEQARTGWGDWAAQADWVAGLAAWRQKDFAAASQAFSSLARRASNDDMTAAGHYWASRADAAQRRPDLAQPHLRAAAERRETFYGMLAESALGLPPQRDDDGAARMREVALRPTVTAAIALAEIGERGQAEALIRWQARIGDPQEHATLTLIAGRIGLPATQLWLAHNGPAGARTTIEGRYPLPEGWSPDGGWRVDKALVFAHALQESQFRTDVTSPAGARGLMQVMPGTAQVIARRWGESFSGSLASPSTNIEYGQRYIEMLRDMTQTGGLLPKVIMAYNCGPAPLDRWNANAAVADDPLLYIESISYWETRGYVTTVLRNYWMYQEQTGQPTASRDALVKGEWPRFPGSGGGAQIVALNR